MHGEGQLVYNMLVICSSPVACKLTYDCVRLPSNCWRRLLHPASVKLNSEVEEAEEKRLDYCPHLFRTYSDFWATWNQNQKIKLKNPNYRLKSRLKPSHTKMFTKIQAIKGNQNEKL